MKISLKKHHVLKFIRRPLEVVLLRYLFGFMVIGPASMYIAWSFSPEYVLDMILINKSVPDENRTEHAAISWILDHEHIVNSKGQAYEKKSDYYGFFPRLGGDFVSRDFAGLDSSEIVELVEQNDMTYIADAYGVYAHDYHGDKKKPNHLLYGGLNQSDVAFIREMRNQKKLVIGEFSIFGPPTSRTVRDSLESLFGVEWSGWIGRYFISLDSTANDALPGWVVKLYQDQHGPSWPFHDSGIVLVKGSEILILEYGHHLNLETPMIETQPVFCDEFDLPASIHYSFWFDIVSSPDRGNQIVSNFRLPVNEVGDSLLQVYKIPRLFPAVLREISEEFPFYYLAGDFSDNPVSPRTAYFKGIGMLQSFFYNANQIEDRREFFWRYYKPLLSGILSTEIQSNKN